MSNQYGPRIVTDGLVTSLYAGNQKSYPGSGNAWLDLSGNSTNATLTTGVSYDTSNGGGLVFSGSSGYAEISNNYNYFAETVIVWAKANTSNWDEYGWISSSRRSNGHVIHPSPNTRTVNHYVLSSSATYTLVGNITPSDITIPHMYTVSTNGSNLHKIYIDGNFYQSNTNSITRNSIPQSNPWRVGVDDYQSLTRIGNGNIFYVMKYNRQLEDYEIQQTYNALKGRFGL